MLLQTRASRCRRRGISLVLVVVSLVSMMGVMAISLEGGLLLTHQRTAQATADAAAMAAAADLYWYYFQNLGTDPNGTAKQCAFTCAAMNGYNNDGVTNKVTVNIPPLSGPYAGQKAYTEVIVEYYHTRGFSSIFGSGNLTVRARTVSVGKPSAAQIGILVLDPSVKSAFNANGGANITVKKVPIIVDSNSTEGSIAGGGAQVSAPEYDLVGNYTTSGGGAFYGPFDLGIKPVADPLAGLPPPDPTKMTVQSTHKVQYTAGTVVLYPGVYKGGLNASSTANLILMPGIYYMDSGGFQFTGQGSLTGYNVMIYTSPGNGNADGINISASGAVTMTPMTTGIYAGIMFWQDRTSTVTATLAGGSNMNIIGTFYFANALLTIDGTSDFVNAGSQYISRTLNVQGSGKLYVDWQADHVAQVRWITIVE